MSRTTILAVAAVLVLVVSAVGGAGAVSPSDSLPAEFDSSTTDAQTVVVAVGDPGTEQGRAALVAANAIASKENYTVVRTPSSRVPVPLVETLSQRVDHGELRNAIVVGVNESNTEAIATAVSAIGADVGGKEVTIDVKDIITADSAAEVVKRASLQTWDSSSEMVLTTLSDADSQKAAVAFGDNATDGHAVMAAEAGYDEVNSTADLLGVSTIYVTPGVSQDTRDKLTNDGYTVKTKVDGVTLDQSLQEVAAGLAENKTEDVAVVGAGDHVYTAAQVGSGANSTLLVTKANDRLGATTEDQLTNLQGTQDVYVLGNDDDVTDSVVSDIASAAPSASNVTRVTRTETERQLYLRTSLLVSGYENGVMVSYVESGEENATVTVTNVGFSTVLETSKVGAAENASVELRWSDSASDVTSSSPSGFASNGDWVVGVSGDMDPADTQTVELDAGSLSNGGHPSMNYYVGSSGALVGTTSGLDFFIDQISQLAGWLQDTIATVLSLGPLSISPSSPVVIAVAVVALAGMLYGFWKLIGMALARRSNS